MKRIIALLIIIAMLTGCNAAYYYKKSELGIVEQNIKEEGFTDQIIVELNGGSRSAPADSFFVNADTLVWFSAADGSRWWSPAEDIHKIEVINTTGVNENTVLYGLGLGLVAGGFMLVKSQGDFQEDAPAIILLSAGGMGCGCAGSYFYGDGLQKTYYLTGGEPGTKEGKRFE